VLGSRLAAENIQGGMRVSVQTGCEAGRAENYIFTLKFLER
jgi:hypothetical protein